MRRLWQMYWFPYAIIIPHRHGLSHLPGLGTAGRVAYLAVTIWLLVRLSVLPPIDRVPEWVFPIAIGLAVSDFTHFWLDFIRRERK